MSNLYFSLSVVFPLFCMMALGYFLKLSKLFSEAFFRQLNALCFRCFLPIILFNNVYHSNFYELFSLKLVLFTLFGIVASFLFLMWLVPKLEKEGKTRGVMVQGIFRSNFIIFGLPLAAAVYQGENLGVVVLLMAFAIPLFNLFSIIALGYFTKGESEAKHNFLKSIARNPLIIASVIGLFYALTQIRLPNLFETTLDNLALVGTPIGLIALGGNFHFKDLRLYKKQLVLSVLGKLIILPGVLLVLAVLFGFRGIELLALMALFASPTAISSYTMAQNVKANDVLASQIVVMTSIFAVITIFLWISVLRALHLIS